MQEPSVSSAGILETPEVETVPGAPSRGMPRWLRRTLSFLIVLAALILLWEGYKAIGSATDNKIPGTDLPLPIRSNDTASLFHGFKILMPAKAAINTPSSPLDHDLLE